MDDRLRRQVNGSRVPGSRLGRSIPSLVVANLGAGPSSVASLPAGYYWQDGVVAMAGNGRRSWVGDLVAEWADEVESEQGALVAAEIEELGATLSVREEAEGMGLSLVSSEGTAGGLVQRRAVVCERLSWQEAAGLGALLCAAAKPHLVCAR